MTAYLTGIFQGTIEHRKLAVDLADVIIKWELQRVKEDQDAEVSDLLEVTSKSVYRNCI